YTTACQTGMPLPLRPFFPGREVLFLLLGQLVDPHAHRLQLEARDLAVDLVGHRVDLVLQLLAVLDHVLGAQGLVGEAHVHHRAGMAFGAGEIDQPAFAEHGDAVAALQRVLVDELAHGPLLRVLLSQPMSTSTLKWPLFATMAPSFIFSKWGCASTSQ